MRLEIIHIPEYPLCYSHWGNIGPGISSDRTQSYLPALKALCTMQNAALYLAAVVWLAELGIRVDELTVSSCFLSL